MNNKIIVIGIVFIILFTVNSIFNNSHASLNAIYQVPIILVNDENVSTPNPFQQMIQLNESNYKGYVIYNRSFANFEFVYNNGTVVPAWIESNNSGKLIIWLKISSISASSSLTIYLDIFPLNDNLLNASGKNGIGEAPELSPTYAEYDDGANVFDFYDNFAGTSLKSSWTTYFLSGYSAGNITVDNGLKLSGGTNWWGLENSYQVPSPSILEFYGENTNSSGYGIGPGIGTYNGVEYLMRYRDWAIQNTINGTPTKILAGGGTSNFNTWYLVSGIYNPGLLFMLVNYSTVISNYPYDANSSNLIMVTYFESVSIFQYARVRAYPPNGVMPKVFFGSLSSIIRISKSEEMNIHTRIYALNLSLPQEWGVYGFFNYSIYGKNYSISISNLTNNYYLNLSINYSFSIFNNTTLSYNLSLYAYKLQDYIAINHLNYKGRLNVTITQREYNITLNDSIIKFENVNNFYYFWNQYGYKVIGSILIIGLFLFFISRLRRMR